jgi:hypothetical protein
MPSAVVSDNFETSTGAIPKLGGDNKATCSAWVNFNGTGTVAIRDSFNVSSITDNGTGDYTVTFTSIVTDNSSIVAGAAYDTTNDVGMTQAVINGRTGSVVYLTSKGSANNTLYDSLHLSAQVFSS